MRKRLLQLAAASLVATAAVLAAAPSAHAVCAEKFSPNNGFQLTCPGPGVFYKLTVHDPAFPAIDKVTTSTTGSASVRVVCTVTGDIGFVPQFVAKSGYSENFQTFNCRSTNSQTNVALIRCGDTMDCR